MNVWEIALAAAVAVKLSLALATVNRDFSVQLNAGRRAWSPRLDELAILLDARALMSGALARPGGHTAQPVGAMAVWGPLGPLLGACCLRLFGDRPGALRLPYVLALAATDLFTALAVMAMTPGPLGLLLALLWVINVNLFAAGRSALPENLATVLLAAMFWLGAAHPDLLAAWRGPLVCAGGLLVALKWNLPVFVLLLALAQGAVGGLDGGQWAAVGLWFAAGLVGGEALAQAFLARFGLSGLRAQSMAVVYGWLRGVRVIRPLGGPALYGPLYAAASGWGALTAFLTGFVDLFVPHGCTAGAARLIKTALWAATIAMGLWLARLLAAGQAALAPQTGVLALYLGLGLAFFGGFSYAAKRAAPLNWAMFTLLAAMAGEVLKDWGLLGMTAALGALAGMAWFALRGWRARPPLAPVAAGEQEEAALKAVIPGRTGLVFQAEGVFPLYWQCLGTGYQASDFVVRITEEALAWTLKHKGHAVLLTGQSGVETPPGAALAFEYAPGIAPGAQTVVLLPAPAWSAADQART